MKNNIAVFLLLFNFIATAQKFNVQQGDEFGTARVLWYKKSIESDNTGFYFLRNKNGLAGTYILHKVDRKTGKTIYLKEISPKFGIYKIFNVDGRLLVFSYDANSNLVKHGIKLLLTQYDSVTGEVIGETLEIDKLMSKKDNQFLDIDISFSPDRKKMLVTTEIKENTKRQEVICKLYDVNGFKKVWEKSPITTYKNSTVSSSEYIVDNQGNLCYIFGYIRSEHKDIIGNYDDINYGIGLASSQNAHTVTFEIDTKGKTIETIKCDLINNEFLCSGQFSDGEITIDDNARRGFFLTVVDSKALELKKQTIQYIDVSVEDKLLKNKLKSGNYLKWGEPKCFLINGCYYIVYQHQYKINGYNNYPASIYKDEILVVKYTKDYQFEWMKLIPKISAYPEANPVNYAVTNKLNMIYYDKPENLTNFPDPNVFTREAYEACDPNKSVLIATSIDDKGVINRTVVDIKDKIVLEDQVIRDFQSNNLKSLVIPIKISKSDKRFDIINFE
ncbi:MAG: hypothetical protein V4677_08920 [Bacteroidota bacterium]